MSEFYPIKDEEMDFRTAGAMLVLTSCWQEYNDTPEDERCDEDFWDAVLPDVLLELDIDQTRARELCELAKLDAQLW